MRSSRKAALAALLLLTAALPVATRAHPAASIEHGFDMESKTLTLKVMHPTPKTDMHYLSSLKISLGDKELVTQYFTVQTDNQALEVKYVLPGLKAGDKLTVDTVCNVGGKYSAEIAIE